MQQATIIRAHVTRPTRRRSGPSPKTRAFIAVSLLMLAIPAAVLMRPVPIDRSDWQVSASETNPSASPAAVLDGDLSTAWQTAHLQHSGQWIQVDLGTQRTFCQVTLDTGADFPDEFPRQYMVMTSQDGVQFDNEVANGAGTSSRTTISFAPQTARFIRIVQTGEDKEAGWTIAELNVYQRAWQNPAALLHPPAPASSETIHPDRVSPGITATGLDYSYGFLHAGGLALNGSAILRGKLLNLTRSDLFTAGSAFSTQRVNVSHFHTHFTLSLTDPRADGMTFTLQNISPSALGRARGDLGYGGLQRSVAVKFDLWNNAGEGPDSTGLFVNGAMPTVPAIGLGPAIDLHSGHPIDVDMVYDGVSLSVKMEDDATHQTASQKYPVNIPKILGRGDGFVGFTGATGGQSAVQSVINWSYGA